MIIIYWYYYYYRFCVINNILYIDIERKTESSNFTLQRRIDSSNDFYLDFNIIGSQIYTYRIRGYDLNSYSDFSNEVTISTFWKWF